MLRPVSLALIAIFLHVQTASAQATDGKVSVEKADLKRAGGGRSADSDAQAHDIPFKRDEASGVGTGLATGTAACLLLLGVWGALQYRARQGQGVWLGKHLQIPGLKRFVSPAPERSLRVMETASLTPQVRLHVVTWRGKEYLISTSSDTVRVLDKGACHGGAGGQPAATGQSEVAE